jgi:predicted Zn finger-like uncharacterized protein
VRIECNNCQAVFSVPDERIPQDRAVKVSCSKCSQSIIVEPEPAHLKEAPIGVDVSLSEVADAPTAIVAELDASGAYDSPLELLEEGARSALVCVDEPERLKAVKEALEELNYYSSVASSIKEALSKLRYNQYDMVMLDEDFCGESAENNTILRYLQPMPMSTRRSIFLMLISTQVKTLDNLMAFARSVNAVISANDIQKVKLVLERAMADHRRFYKVYLDSIDALGVL